MYPLRGEPKYRVHRVHVTKGPSLLSIFPCPSPWRLDATHSGPHPPCSFSWPKEGLSVESHMRLPHSACTAPTEPGEQVGFFNTEPPLGPQQQDALQIANRYPISTTAVTTTRCVSRIPSLLQQWKGCNTSGHSIPITAD